MEQDKNTDEALELIAEIMTLQVKHLAELKKRALDDLEELVQ